MHGAGSIEYARLEGRLVSMLKDTNPSNWREISSNENTEEHSTPIQDAPADGLPASRLVVLHVWRECVCPAYPAKKRKHKRQDQHIPHTSHR